MLNIFGFFYWMLQTSVQTLQPIILIYRKGVLVIIIGDFINLSPIVLSLRFYLLNILFRLTRVIRTKPPGLHKPQPSWNNLRPRRLHHLHPCLARGPRRSSGACRPELSRACSTLIMFAAGLLVFVKILRWRFPLP